LYFLKVKKEKMGGEKTRPFFIIMIDKSIFSINSKLIISLNCPPKSSVFFSLFLSFKRLNINNKKALLLVI